jgi:hypothetical protein
MYKKIVMGCVTVMALGGLIVGLSFMYVCAVIVLTNDLPMPPNTLFLGLFMVLSGMITIAAVSALMNETPFDFL